MCVPLAGRPVPPDWAFAFKSIGPPINFNMMHMSTVKMKVDAARNKSAEWALQNKLKYTFFLGDDVVPPPHVLRRFIFLMENNPEIEVLGGIYFTKEEHPMPLVFRGNGAGPYWDWKVGELFAVSGIGMDCTLIRTSLFERLKQPWFKTINADTYAEDIPKVECWTEDLYFCDQIEKQLNRPWNKRPAVFADSSIICDHWDVGAMKKYSLPWNSKPATRMFAHGNKKILDLGCGGLKQVFKEGIPIRVDIRDDVEADYRCDLRQLPFKDEFADIVHAAHTLEHFSRKELPEVLDEWLRVLKVGGELRLEVPNLEFAAKEIVKHGGLSSGGMDVLYGQQAYDLDYHKCGFTQALLKHVLQAKGLKIKRMWVKPDWVICVEAKKTKKREGLGDGEGAIISRKSVDESIAMNNQLVKALSGKDKDKSEKKAGKSSRKSSGKASTIEKKNSG
jgi:predicted SAM-dependent methyltransferase